MDSQTGKNDCVFLLLLKFLFLKWSAHVILGSLSQILPAKEGFIYICYITLFIWGAMLKLCEDLWGMKWYSESCGELLVLVLFYLPMQYMKERISRKKPTKILPHAEQFICHHHTHVSIPKNSNTEPTVNGERQAWRLNEVRTSALLFLMLSKC